MNSSFLIAKFWNLKWHLLGLACLWISAWSDELYNWPDSNFYRGEIDAYAGTDLNYKFPRILYGIVDNDSIFIFSQLVISSVVILYFLQQLDLYGFTPIKYRVFLLGFWILILSSYYAPWQGSILSEGLFSTFQILLLGSVLEFFRGVGTRAFALLALSILLLYFTRPTGLVFILILLLTVPIFRKVTGGGKLITIICGFSTLAIGLAILSPSNKPGDNAIVWMDDSYKSLQVASTHPGFLEELNAQSQDKCTDIQIRQALSLAKFDTLESACGNLVDYLNNHHTYRLRILYLISNPMDYLKDPYLVSSVLSNYYTTNAISLIPDGLSSFFVNSSNVNYKINSDGGVKLNLPVIPWLLISIFLLLYAAKKKDYGVLFFSAFGLISVVAIGFLIQLEWVGEPSRHSNGFLFNFYLCTLIALLLLEDRNQKRL